ncbi:hypothetical protein [Streptomyces sp. NPDC054834]
MCQLAAALRADGVLWVHDYAYVQPAVVGRLTAAALTYAFNGRRLGGRSRFSLQES